MVPATLAFVSFFSFKRFPAQMNEVEPKEERHIAAAATTTENWQQLTTHTPRALRS